MDVPNSLPGVVTVALGCSPIEGKHQMLLGNTTCMCGAVRLTGASPWVMPVTFHPSHAAPVSIFPDPPVKCGTATTFASATASA